MRSTAAAASLALLAACHPLSASASIAEGFTPDTTVYDGAKIIGSEKREQLAGELQSFEERTGWRVRVFTSYGADARPSDDQLRATWAPDRRTVVINFDPSNPNLTNFVHLGDEVLSKLRRPWWTELQGRYGNLFYIRQEGEQQAVLSTLGAIEQCLEPPQGCRVVPGVQDDQLAVCLASSVAGGIVAGAVSRLEPSGWITSRFGWLIVFSPLWAALFINFGLGPIISRTDDIAPVAINTAAFLAAAASPYILSNLLRAPPPAAQ